MVLDRHAIEISAALQDFEADAAKGFPRLQLYFELAKSRGLVEPFLWEALECFYFSCALRPDSVELPLLLRVAANSSALPFGCAFKPALSMPLFNLMGESFTYTPNLATSVTDLDKDVDWVDIWFTSLFLNVIESNVLLRDMLCRVPEEFIFPSSQPSSSVAAPTFVRFMAQGAIELFLGLRIAEDTFRKAMEMAVIEGLEGACRDRVKMLDIPVLAVAAALVDGNEGRFNGALADAVKLHREFWANPKGTFLPRRPADYHGFISIPLTSLAVTAARRGMIVSIESPYLPVHFAQPSKSVKI